MAKEELRVGNHKWPESIDLDRDGNLYFTDAIEKALFRIKRNKDGTLASQDEKLLSGFKDAGGISIDRKNNDLYIGVRLRENGGVTSKILQIPLIVFDEPYEGCTYSTNSFKRVLESKSLAALEHPIKPTNTHLPLPRPNGVLFDPRTRKTFYTHTDLFGKKGYLGDTSNSKVKEFISPNGIDMDPTTNDLTLVFSLTTQNKIIRLNLSTGQQMTKELIHEKQDILGLTPDGLLCLENGDVLTASFLPGKIYYLAWNGQSYHDPLVVVDDLDRPTDMAIGPSSDGKSESLFITTVKLHRLFFSKGGGKIVEIPNIRELIKIKQNAKERRQS
jgi:sugar lactone lactonase YvrE